MAVLALEGVGFSYGSRGVLVDVSFELPEGKVFVILGPSGAGKSTVLRLAAGLDAPSSGHVRLNGRLASSPGRVLIGPSERDTSLVFQDLALWPHLTCDHHLSFAGPALGPKERAKLLEDVGLNGFADRRPGEMSGGERQRLALARALASKPRLLLLDEPFSSLDPILRLDLRELLRDLHRRHGVGMLYVTHDLHDAFFLGDEIVFLSCGRVGQVGSPEQLYWRPAALSVATFVGKAAVVDGSIRGQELDTGFGRLPNPRPELGQGREVQVVIRPEDVRIGDGGVEARVEGATFEDGRYVAKASAGSCSIWFHSESRPAPGQIVFLHLKSGWPIPE